MLIDAEAYDLLANHASHLNMTPDTLANYFFEWVLTSKKRTQEVIALIRQEKEALKVAVK
jgi:hypothetical protein